MAGQMKRRRLILAGIAFLVCLGIGLTEEYKADCWDSAL